MFTCTHTHSHILIFQISHPMCDRNICSMHTHRHSHTHIYTHTHHTHTCAHTHTHIHRSSGYGTRCATAISLPCIHTHSHTHTCAHTYIHTYTDLPYTPDARHQDSLPCIHTCIYIYIYIYIYTHTHTHTDLPDIEPDVCFQGSLPCIHTHTHTHTHTDLPDIEPDVRLQDYVYAHKTWIRHERVAPVRCNAARRLSCRGLKDQTQNSDSEVYAREVSRDSASGSVVHFTSVCVCVGLRGLTSFGAFHTGVEGVHQGGWLGSWLALVHFTQKLRGFTRGLTSFFDDAWSRHTHTYTYRDTYRYIHTDNPWSNFFMYVHMCMCVCRLFSMIDGLDDSAIFFA